MIKHTLSGRKVLYVALIALLGSSSLYAQLYPVGVQNAPMRHLSRYQFVKNMFVGWNLGNTMDCSGTMETGWGNPVTTQAMIDAVAREGFKTMREPVTWKGHFGAGPTYTIDAAFLARVVAIANYALNDSMYVLVNTHHDGTTGGWYSLAATATSNPSVAQITAEVVAIWTQIANAFKNYSDYVVFEIFNEPQNGAPNMYNGGDANSRANLAAYQTAAVNAIRATGGNNATRMIMLQGISASAIAVSVATIPMVDTNCLVSIHTYYPQSFCLPPTSTNTWGSHADSQNVVSQLDGERTMVATKGGVAVVGEWASPASDILTARVAHAYYYSQQCRAHAMVPVWWDDGGLAGGGFGILNRNGNPPNWQYKTVADALIGGANSATFPPPPPVAIMPTNGIVKDGNAGVMVKAGAINYTLPKTSLVSLRLYNMQGKIVANLVKSVQSAGDYEVKLPSKGISFGTYALEFKTGNDFITKRLTIVQ